MSDGKWEIKVTNIDANSLFSACQTAMVHGLNTWLEIVATQARQKAPLRRAFKDQMSSRRTAWRTVLVGKGSAESAMANYRLMYSGMTPNESRNVRTKISRGGRVNVQVRSWQVQGPASSRAQNWAKGNAVVLLGQSHKGLAHEHELTPRARWAYMQALREWREPGAGSYQMTEGKETVVGAFKDLQTKTVEGDKKGGESALTVIMKGERGEANAAARLADLGAYASKSAVVQMGGTLRKSIRSTRASVNGTTVTGRVVAEARYAKYVEFGTATRGRAQPFLRPALHQNRGQLPRSVASDVRHVIAGGKA